MFLFQWDMFSSHESNFLLMTMMMFQEILQFEAMKRPPPEKKKGLLAKSAGRDFDG